MHHLYISACRKIFIVVSVSVYIYIYTRYVYIKEDQRWKVVNQIFWFRINMRISLYQKAGETKANQSLCLQPCVYTRPLMPALVLFSGSTNNTCCFA